VDILEALANEAPASSDRKCKVGRWLSDIDTDVPGLAALYQAVESSDPEDEHYRTGDQALRLVYRLGLKTSLRTLYDHRAQPQRCRCGD
jgi:hypothetical protein